MKKIISILLCTLIFSCTNDVSQQNSKEMMDTLKSKDYEAEKYFNSNLVIILAKKLTNDSKTISVQQYKSEVGDFVPVFTSTQAFKESTKGVDIGKDIIEVNGYFLLSLMDGTEIIKINPDLKDEKIFKASELIEQFKEEIAGVKKKPNS